MSVLSLKIFGAGGPPACPAGPGENRPSGNACSSSAPRSVSQGLPGCASLDNLCEVWLSPVPARRGLICKIRAATAVWAADSPAAQGGMSGPLGLSSSPSNPLLNKCSKKRQQFIDFLYFPKANT